MDIVLHRAAPPEAAAEHRLVHDDLLRRHLGGSRRRGQRRFAALSGYPDLDLVGVDGGRAVLRLHRRMAQKRRSILGLDPL